MTIFHGSSSTEHGKAVLEEFKQTGSTVRCLICTVAFGMGVNIPDVEQVCNTLSFHNGNVITYHLCNKN